MNASNLEHRFKRLWKKADYKLRQKILREIHGILNRKKAEKQKKEAFFQAVKSENIEAVKRILNRGIDVNQKDDELGNTALTYAVITGNPDLVKLLLKYRANPQIKNKKGHTCMDAAKLIGNKNILQLLSKGK